MLKKLDKTLTIITEPYFYIVFVLPLAIILELAYPNNIISTLLALSFLFILLISFSVFVLGFIKYKQP